MGEGVARRAARRSRAQAAFGRRPHPEEGVPCGPYACGLQRTAERRGPKNKRVESKK